jgi:hypothetical protein
MGKILGVASGVAALVAAFFWAGSTLVEVPAPAETGGVGALLGGWLIALNTKGNRIDLPATLQRQSKWNKWAAWAAAASAILGVAAAAMS